MAPSRAAQKAEAKYNVTSNYFDLQLHSAAANGNVGLVKYALMHGQPVNSVLNGVLPIHVAASAGNEHVVQMLIEAGADVNAPRLPRKYNADKGKAASSIGVAGSTPLHFAAANGHANVASLLLSHGANPDLQEKHGFTAEDVARQFDQVNVLTVLRLWRDSRQRELEEDLARQGGTVASTTIGPGRLLRSDTDNRSLSPSVKSFQSISSPLRSPLKFGKGSGSDAASINSTSTARRLLGKPSLDSLTTFGSKGKSKLVKALQTATHGSVASSNTAGGNVIRTFPAPPPLSLRQNPVATQTGQTAFGTASRHHLVNTDKVSKTSLPSVFEKGMQQSFPSIRATLGLTPSNSSLSINRTAGSSISDLNDPYRFSRAKPSSSRTSLSSVFRSSSSRDRGSEPLSQPLSPAASSFFTEDYELERAERDAFLRGDSREQRSEHDVSSGDETYMQLRLPLGHHRHYLVAHAQEVSHESATGNIARRSSTEAGVVGRSRAGSSSSAATTGSGRSYAYPYPITAPPTQTTFFPYQSSVSTSPEGPPLSAHPSSAFGSSTLSANVAIPAPIPPPPSSSTQPFFSKAAISAAHSNPAIARPGFYRPRKSSALSNSASNASDAERDAYQVPENMDFGTRYPALSDTAVNERHSSNPAVVIRRPTVVDIDTRQANTATEATLVHTLNHSLRQGAHWPQAETIETDESLSSSADRLSQATSAATDIDLARENEDIFPTSPERVFPARSRAGSRARADSIAFVLNASAMAPSGTQTTLTINPGAMTSTLLNQAMAEQDGSVATSSRVYRSGSVSTDTRTSRSGSLGEGHGPSSRYFGYDYSSSPAASVASLAYQPSHSTVATSVVSSPPGTAYSHTASSSTTASEVGSRGVTYAEAQSMVKQREMQLLSFDTSQDSDQSGLDRQQSLSSQLAAYAESLSIERQLSDAEKRRTSFEPPPLLVIPEAPEGPKYSWEILGKEARTLAPITKGQRRRDDIAETDSRQPMPQHHQRMWTHRMVSPYEASLPRLMATSGTVKSSMTAPPITSGGRVFPLSPTILEDVDPGRVADAPAIEAAASAVSPKERPLRNKTSTLSSTGSHLAVPGGSDVSSIRLPRRKPSASPVGKSPRSSQEKDRQPSTKYHVAGGPGSEPTDSANSSLVSEPRSHMHLHDSSSNLSMPRSIRHRHTRSDPPLAKVPSRSPEVVVTSDDTPRQPSILRTVVAPKFHTEPRVGGESAPSPTKTKLSSKIGKMFAK